MSVWVGVCAPWDLWTWEALEEIGEEERWSWRCACECVWCMSEYKTLCDNLSIRWQRHISTSLCPWCHFMISINLSGKTYQVATLESIGPLVYSLCLVPTVCTETPKC